MTWRTNDNLDGVRIERIYEQWAKTRKFVDDTLRYVPPSDEEVRAAAERAYPGRPKVIEGETISERIFTGVYVAPKDNGWREWRDRKGEGR